jgi:hypothetical protein
MMWLLTTGNYPVEGIMHIAYWIIAALLAAMYLFAGGKKLVQSQEQLQPMMEWVDRVPMPAVRLLGAVEIAGAAGLILPPLTGIAPALAIAAAVGLVLIQVGGIVLHVSRRELSVLGLNLVLLAAAGVLVWLGTSWV